MGLHVISPGFLTTVQDGGRTKYLYAGISQSGAMDTRAMHRGNHLVGNPIDEAVLEMTVFGATIEFTDPHTIALTGADMSPLLNGTSVSNDSVVLVQKGDILTCSYAKTGCRCYLAVAGGIEVPMVMGSKSTNLQAGLGGYHGRALKQGDMLETGSLCVGTATGTLLEKEAVPVTGAAKLIRIVLGPQEASFTNEGIHTFLTTPYTLTTNCNRMGYKLKGEPIALRTSSDILSDGVVFGSIQVSSNGQPMIMMADHQTTGGYAKIATVCSVDLPILAQCKPDDVLYFKKISIGKAQKLLRKERHCYDRLYSCNTSGTS